MSDYTAKNSYLASDDVETCSCGCIFEVIVSQQDGHNESEEYYCPDCRKQYKTWASLSPTVRRLGHIKDEQSPK